VEASFARGRLASGASAGCQRMSLLTAAAGLLLASAGSYETGTLALHRWAGVICAGLAIVVWLAHIRRGVVMARVTLGVLFIATTIAGHLGATLTHGAGVTNWFNKAAPRAATPIASGVQADPVVKSAMQVMENSCIECHGAKKARGKLRLDTREAALAGGKSGQSALTPGKPETSELIRRVKLPRDDDESMPSRDGPGLSATEIKALETWIGAGGRWP
jgi:hypothetical protein